MLVAAGTEGDLVVIYNYRPDYNVWNRHGAYWNFQMGTDGSRFALSYEDGRVDGKPLRWNGGRMVQFGSLFGFRKVTGNAAHTIGLQDDGGVQRFFRWEETASPPQWRPVPIPHHREIVGIHDYWVAPGGAIWASVVRPQPPNVLARLHNGTWLVSDIPAGAGVSPITNERVILQSGVGAWAVIDVVGGGFRTALLPTDQPFRRASVGPNYDAFAILDDGTVARWVFNR